MIESGGIAPYAPTPAVLGVIHAYRDRPLPTPITTDVIEKIGIAPTIAPRTLQALKLLDLLDPAGNPSVALQDLRKAGAEEYRVRLAEVLRAAYAEVFIYRDPAVDEPEKVEDAFRSFKPMSTRDRMVRLFLGLCAEAGIIDNVPRVPKVRPVGAAAANVVSKPQAARLAAQHDAPESTVDIVSRVVRYGGDVAQPRTLVVGGTTAGADHLAIRGLLQTLPPIGSVFPDSKRKEWADAVIAAFALIYEREEPTKGPGDSD